MSVSLLLSRIRSFDWCRHRWPWMTLNRVDFIMLYFTEFDSFADITSQWLKMDLYHLQIDLLSSTFGQIKSCHPSCPTRLKAYVLTVWCQNRYQSPEAFRKATCWAQCSSFHILMTCWSHVDFRQSSSQPSCWWWQTAYVSVSANNVSLARQILERYIRESGLRDFASSYWKISLICHGAGFLYTLGVRVW